MNNVENAYASLARYVRAFVGNRAWDVAVCKCQIYHKMASGSHWLIHKGVTDERGGFEGGNDAMWEGLDAARFLRDNLLSTTGDRIWGLTFTLYPDGKFNIEYDYTKPEGYVETEEVVEVNPVELSNMAKGL